MKRRIPMALLVVGAVGFYACSDGPAAVDDAEVGPFPFFDIACRRPGDALPAADGAVDCDALLQPADWVLAAGNPFKVAEGAEPVSISHGVFSTRTRLDAKRRVREFPYHGDVLVIDAATSNPGSPGSALVIALAVMLRLPAFRPCVQYADAPNPRPRGRFQAHPRGGVLLSDLAGLPSEWMRALLRPRPSR